MDKNITTPATSGNSFAPKLTLIHAAKIGVKLEGCCLKQDNVFYIV